jgi:hypothetical protein
MENSARNAPAWGSQKALDGPPAETSSSARAQRRESFRAAPFPPCRRAARPPTLPETAAMKSAALIALLAVILVVTLLAGIYLWWSLGDVDISIHGLIAMTLGCLVSLALGGGLMFLVFYSNRHGHDDEQHRGPRG